MDIKRFRTYLDADFLTEMTLLFIKDHMKKLLAIFVLLLACVFGLMYFLHKKHEEEQSLVQKYIIAQGKVLQQENAVALEMFQSVYNNSKGILEVMALNNILDLLIQDKQYTTVKTLLQDIPTLKQKPETFILLYSKALTVILQLKDKGGISPKEELNMYNAFAKHLAKVKISEKLNAHKQVLLFSFGQKLDKKLLKSKSENELTSVLKIIQENN